MAVLDTAATKQGQMRISLLLGAGLLVVTTAVFAPILSYDFVAWDDNLHVYANPRFQPVTLDHVLAFWRQPYEHLYIPLTYTIWAALAWLSSLLAAETGLTLMPGLFHGMNLLVHLGSVLIVFRLGQLLLDIQAKRGARTTVAAAAGALLFATHPLQVEAVAWVSGLRDVLCGFWGLMAVWQYLEFARLSDRWRRWSHYGLATIAYALALLAKPLAVVIPFVAGVLVFWSFRPTLYQQAKTLLGWLGIAIAWGAFTKWLQPDVIIPAIAPLWARPLIMGDTLAFYLYKLVLPVWLGPNYERSPRVVLAHDWGYFTWLVPCVLAFWLWRYKRRVSGLVAAAAVFVGGLGPGLGGVPFLFQGYSTVADRYVYIAMLGVALGLGWVLTRQSKLLLLAVWILALGLLVLRSGWQVQYWRDTMTLFAHAVRVNPQSPVAHNILGSELARQGNLTVAIEHYFQALQLRPSYADAHNNLGLALFRQSQIPAAIHHYMQALQLDPDHAVAHYNLGVVLLSQERYTEAIHQFGLVVQLEPAWTEAHHHLGLAFTWQGRHREAITAYRTALRLRPDWPQVATDLAWLLVTEASSAQDTAEAVALAEQACRATDYQDAIALRTLAAAYYAAGHSDAARQAAQDALILVKAQGKRSLVSQIETQLSSYTIGHAVYETP